MAIESTPKTFEGSRSQGSGGYRGGSSRPPYSPSAGGPAGMAGKGRMKPPFKKRSCRICEERKGHIDWKAINYLRSFVTDRGKILAGRSKGTCAPCQRKLSNAIKRARTMALLPTSPL